ncbi:MAG TPA: LPS-assembly protein LptD [Alicycliphilus sp.]|nr:LPS-assembly protein LptD [Alicycliphilus sp.]
MDRPFLPHDLSTPLPLPVGLRRPLARLVALMLCGAPLAVLAQAGDGDEPQQPPDQPPPVLRTSPKLQETLPPEVRQQLPVFVRGDHVTGQPDIRAIIDGNAELRRGDTVIRADHMDYDVAEDRAKASGHVHINRAGNLYDGTLLDLRVDAFSGFFNDARYRFLLTQAHGEAARVDFVDHDRSVVHDANYTTCQRGDEANWQPDWIIRAKTIRLDQAEDVGEAEDGVLEFKGVPVLPVGNMSFPLSERRKSGLLPPTIGLNSISGVEYSQPYYWNIAPNRDATITPVLMSRRGAAVGSEFRYLEPRYSGELTADYMPNDTLRDRQRWSYTARHRGAVGTPLGDMGLSVDVRRVSDNDYWRDFTPRLFSHASTTGIQSQYVQRLLPGQASLGWTGGEQSLSLNTTKWQTLQDVTAPITPPYDRMPQLHWRYQPLQLAGGFDATVDADYTVFRADRKYYTQPNGRRSYAVAQLSRPFLAPGGYITPKVQLHATQYQFDNALPNGETSASRTLPTFSLDSGLVFEREAQFFGGNYLQTLEPRAYYTYTPYRNQSLLPVYDTAPNDFNFASAYTENAFGGNDRIADNNLFTLGVTTRLLHPDTGAEAARFGVAQRLRLSDQRVTMPGAPPVTDRVSDVLLGAGINWTPQWSLDSTVQYNPKTDRSQRTTLLMRYSPGPFRTVSAAYRMQKVTNLIAVPSEQLDLGWQWPIGDPRSGGADKGRAGGRWYTVGRLNYSLQDRKMVDTIVGLESESCCWIGRVVLERLQSSQVTASTRLLFQIEFSGFSRLSLGSNPLTALKRYVPGYQFVGENTQTPSRFSQYD